MIVLKKRTRFKKYIQIKYMVDGQDYLFLSNFIFILLRVKKDICY